MEIRKIMFPDQLEQKLNKIPSQPIKAVCGCAYLSSQLCGKWKEKDDGPDQPWAKI
jgi:hypothetical protein